MGEPSYLCRVLFARAPVLRLCFYVHVLPAEPWTPAPQQGWGNYQELQLQTNRNVSPHRELEESLSTSTARRNQCQTAKQVHLQRAGSPMGQPSYVCRLLFARAPVLGRCFAPYCTRSPSMPPQRICREAHSPRRLPSVLHPPGVLCTAASQTSTPQHVGETTTLRTSTNLSPVTASWRKASLPRRRGATLAFARYCHDQQCVVYIAITGGRGGTYYCAIVRTLGGERGVPKERVGAQRIVMIRAQNPRNKTIFCIGQDRKAGAPAEDVKRNALLQPRTVRATGQHDTYVYTYIYMYIYIYIFIYVYVCMYVYIHVQIDRYIQMYIDIHRYTDTQIHIYIYTYIYIYIYI